MEKNLNNIVLVLLRHFPSAWNDPQARKFTGWLNIDLAPGSYEEGVAVGHQLQNRGFAFDRCCTSTLKRATRSLAAVLEGMNQSEVPVEQDKRLNERNYGILQGRSHAAAVAEHGAQQVQQWRRSFRTRPPEGESLEDTCARVVSYWDDRLVPMLKRRQRPLVVAHGNSLRALMIHIGKMDHDAIEQFEIPTGKPLICSLDPDSLMLRHKEYL